MRKEIVRISPLRTGIVAALVLTVFYVCVGVMSLALSGFFLEQLPPIEDAPAFGTSDQAGLIAASSVMMLIFGTVLIIIAGFALGAVVALIYNLVVTMSGGLIVTLEDPSSQ